MSHDPIKVLYIGGYSRSGSTLLLRLLGQQKGFVSVGEVWDIWNRSFAENQLCGCGRPFRECEFWQAVVQDAFGGFQQVDVETMQALRSAVQSNSRVPSLVLPFLRTSGYRDSLKSYAEALGRLYQGIHHVSGSKVIVDSSKVPPYAFILNQVPNIDLRIAHLIRDSRATAHSWQRKKIRPEIHWKQTYMEQYSPVRSAMEWNLMNALLQALKFSGSSYMRLRYEDLVERPRESLRKIFALLEEGQPEIDFLDNGHAVHLGVDHTLSGNPNRFEKGTIKIKPDVEWKEKMPPRQKALVTAITWPLLGSYGYFNLKQGFLEEKEPIQAGEKSRNNGSHAFSKPGSLRILMVTARFLPYIGGTEIHTSEVARRLAAVGNQVTVLTACPGQVKITRERSGAVEIIRVPARPKNSDLYFAPEIYRIIRNGGWDIIHCQGYHTLVAPIAMLAARRANIPYIVTFHSGGHSSWLRNRLRPLQQAVLRPLLAGASRLVGVSNWEADFFRKRLHLPDERFVVIPNGTHLPQIEVKNPAGNQETLIVSIGRLERYKGHHRVLSALPQVLEQNPEVRLRILGSGPYEATLKQLANELGIAGSVEIKAVSGSDREGMASVLMGAALVILLSDYESQGISVMEALALGRPVLVANGTALRELATSGLARATSMGSTKEEIAAAILDQLRQPLIPANTALPSWERCAEQLLSLYYHTLARERECAS